jgi:uncharacterized protein (TIGR02117 family)
MRKNSILNKAYIYIPLLLPLLLVFTYLCLTGLGLIFSRQKEYKDVKKYKIYIATGGIHADFILPYKSKIINWSNYIRLDDFKNLRFIPKYIQVGWGERGFYLDMKELKNLTIPVAIRAALLPSASLMHVTYYNRLPSEYYNMKQVEISEKQYKELVEHIKSGFRTGNNGVNLIPNEGYYNYNWMVDNFYEGNGDYHLFNTCNMWTADGMYKAGIKTSIFTPFKYGVSRFLK